MPNNRAFLESHVATLNELIAGLPEWDIVGRKSLEHRRAEFQSELDNLPKEVRITEDDRKERDLALEEGLATVAGRRALVDSFEEKMKRYHRPISPYAFGVIFENLNSGKRLLKTCQENKDSVSMCKRLIAAILRLEREMDLELGFQKE